MVNFKTQHPIDNTLCVFKLKGNLFILGYIDEQTGQVKRYGVNEAIQYESIEGYQEVLNEKGGFYYVN